MLDRPELGWIGLDWVGFGQDRLDGVALVRLGRVEFRWIGVDFTGLVGLCWIELVGFY